jgi:hypothetical protein
VKQALRFITTSSYGLFTDARCLSENKAFSGLVLMAGDKNVNKNEKQPTLHQNSTDLL